MLNVDVFHTRHLNHDNFRRSLQAMATNTTRTVAMLSESGCSGKSLSLESLVQQPQHSVQVYDNGVSPPADQVGQCYDSAGY